MISIQKAVAQIIVAQFGDNSANRILAKRAAQQIDQLFNGGVVVSCPARNSSEKIV